MNVLNLPNCISLFRFALIPGIIYLITLTEPWAVWLRSSLFILAGLSDWLDGFLARRRQLGTLLGMFLDPLADKVLNLAILVTLVPTTPFRAWFAGVVMLILACDISISAMEGIALSQGMRLGPVRGYRAKDVCLFIGLLSLLLPGVVWGIPFQLMGGIALVLATVFLLLSTFDTAVQFHGSWKQAKISSDPSRA